MKFDRFSLGLIGSTLSRWSDLSALAQQVNVEAKAGPKGMAGYPAAILDGHRREWPRQGDEAVAKGWTVVGMKDDSKTIFPSATQ